MAFWDLLRPITQQVISFDFVTSMVVFVLSIALFAISFLAFRRTKSNRFLFVTIAFFFFSAKWALKVMDLFLSPGNFFHRAAENVFELVILASLFMAIFKK